MTRDEKRSARLLFDEELRAGLVSDEAVTTREVLSAVASKPVPSTPSRNLQRLLVKRGTLTAWDDFTALHAIRSRVLGADVAKGPPRLLVRVDEFPHYEAWDKPETYGTAAFERFHRTLADSGVPYLIAVTPRVPRHPLDPEETAWRPHDEGESDVLARLRAEGVSFGVHGLDHRTRHTDPRKHSELVGLSEDALEERLDLAQEVLRDAALPADVFVPPYNRFAHRQYRQLARRFDVVCGGPETVRLMGWHRTPLWRGDAVYLPSPEPFYAPGDRIVEHVERLAELEYALWIPVTLHWGWEQDAGWSGLERFAAAAAGLARPWDELLAAAQRSRRDPVPPGGRG